MRLNLPGDQTTSDGAVCDNGNAQFSTRLENVGLLRFNVEEDGAVFDLVRGDGMDGVGASNRSCRAFRKAKILDLARPKTTLACI